MIKRQDSSLRSSSSRHENATENLHAKTIGCMSGIFSLLSKYHTSRKFLTFGGKRQEKNGIASSCTRTRSRSISTKASTQTTLLAENKNGDNSINYLKRSSCNNVPRSPTLPAAIRQSISVDSPAPENFRTPPALVARLMGLEEAPINHNLTMPKGLPPAAPPEATTTQKRQQLLGALEKCDEDLKALKKVIDAVRAAEGLRSPEVVKRMDVVGNKRFNINSGARKCLDQLNMMSEQPSPVSVLDHDQCSGTRSPFSCNHHYSKKQMFNVDYGRAQSQQRQLQRKKPGEEDFINPSMIKKITTDDHQKTHNIVEASSSWLWNGKDLMESSVAEVCRDIAWGERREVGRIGLALQDHICKDLIEEMVKEMGYTTCVYSLPFEACKRRLCF